MKKIIALLLIMSMLFTLSGCGGNDDSTPTGATINAQGSFEHRADGKYSYTYRITDDMSSGKWVFSSTFIGDKYSMYGSDTISDKSNVFFYVQ